MLIRPLSIAGILVVVFCSGFSSNIKAQETVTESGENPAPPFDSDEERDEVVVIGDRVEGSGSRRRAAAGRDQLDESDQTDMQGFFDDIDGLSTLGGDDEGNAFSIDGLGADLSKVTLDGQSFGEGRGNGGFGAGDMSPDMILRVDVFRTPTAAMEEGGAGGRVNLQLRNPVDIPKPLNSIKAKLGYVPDKNDFSPSASLFVGRPSESKKFGYMLSVNLSDREKHFGSQDITSWALRDFDGTSAYVPRQVRSSSVTSDQHNIFAGLILGIRPHRSLDISGKIFLSQKEKGTENFSLQHRIDRQRDVLMLAFDERIVSELDSFDDSRRNLRVVGSTRADQTDSVILGADINWHKGGWRMEGAVGHSTVNSNSDTPSQTIAFGATSAFGYAAADDGSLLMSYPGEFPADEDFTASRINLSARNTKDTNRFGGIDLIRQLGDGFIRRLRFGGKIREMTRTRRSSRGLASLDQISLSDIGTRETQQTPWDAIAWPGIDLESVHFIAQESQIDWQENLLNEYDIEQRSSAGYLQADFRASLAEERFLVGNIGARIVATETRITGFQDFGEGAAPVSQKTSYTDVLPSLSMRMRIAERASLTLGMARVMTRPAFNNLAPGIRVNHDDKTARSGNPDLQPFRANQYLAELAWAPERGRRLSANITYRDVKNYFALSEEAVEIGDDIFLVTRPINGDAGFILTASVKLNQNLRQLTAHLRNFAVSLSYTHNRSRTDFLDPFSGEKLPIPNTAEHVVKADLTYSKNSFAGKLRYHRRGKSLKSSFSESGLSVWNQPVGSLDLNLAWQLRENVKLGFDARNLLNEEKIQTTDDSSQLLRITERDRSLSATLRVKWE